MHGGGGARCIDPGPELRAGLALQMKHSGRVLAGEAVIAHRIVGEGSILVFQGIDGVRSRGWQAGQADFVIRVVAVLAQSGIIRIVGDGEIAKNILKTEGDAALDQGAAHPLQTVLGILDNGADQLRAEFLRQIIGPEGDFLIVPEIFVAGIELGERALGMEKIVGRHAQAVSAQHLAVLGSALVHPEAAFVLIGILAVMDEMLKLMSDGRQGAGMGGILGVAVDVNEILAVAVGAVGLIGGAEIAGDIDPFAAVRVVVILDIVNENIDIAIAGAVRRRAIDPGDQAVDALIGVE
ncbi:MAG: hypothetical protein BWY77_00683 [bacterium ADurb.Bin431]|nr:MAG: hypothetical protein BWY77_00683 [bacterium ADurb.Bin431]